MDPHSHVDRDWSNAPFVGGNESREAASIHKSQHEISRTKVMKLVVRCPDGNVHTISQGDEETRLRLAMTGGTDFPALELHLRVSLGKINEHEPAMYPPVNTKVLKFPLVEYDSLSDPQMKERQPIPETSHDRRTRFGPTNMVPTGLFDFTLAAQQVQMTVDYETKKATLQWKYARCIEFNRNVENKIRNDVPFHTLNVFNCLRTINRRPGDDPDAPQHLEVTFKYAPALEWAYRRLISTPNNVIAYWRWCLDTDSPLQMVPGNIAVTEYPVTHPDAYYIDGRRRKPNKITGLPGSIHSQIDDTKGEMVPFMHPIYQFSNEREMEVFTKCPEFYENAALQQKISKALDSQWRYSWIRLTENRSVFFINVEINDNEEVEIPKQGDQAVIVWKQTTDIDEKKPKAHRWVGTVLPSPSHLGFNVAILAKKPPTSPDIQDLEKLRFTANFVFSEDEVDIVHHTKAINRVIYGDVNLKVPFRNWVKTFLMGRYNRLPRDMVHYDPEGEHKSVLLNLVQHLNQSQRMAVFTFLARVCSIVQGPPGTGKSDIGAICIVLCVLKNEKVFALAQTNAAVCALLDKTLETFKELGAPSNILDSIIWYRGGIDERLEILSEDFLHHEKSLGVQDVEDLPEEPRSAEAATRWATKAVKVITNPHQKHQYSTSTSIYRALQRAELADFQPGSESYSPREMYLLKRLHNVIKSVKEYQTQDPTTANVLRDTTEEAKASSKLRTLQDKAMEDFELAWDNVLNFWMRHKMRVVFSTFGKVVSEPVRRYEGTVGIIDEAACLTNFMLTVGLGTFLPTLKRWGLFGDPNQLLPFHGTESRDAMRQQHVLDPMTRLVATGIAPTKLDTQYRMHPDISRHPIKFIYSDGNGNPELFNAPETEQRAWTGKCAAWCNKFTQGSTAKASVIANVPGKCMVPLKGHSNINFQQIVAMVDIVKDLLASGFVGQEILVMFFYGESVRVFKNLLLRLDIMGIEVEKIPDHVSSVDSAQGRQNIVTLIGTSKGGGGSTIGFLSSPNRLNVAMTRAQGLRIVVMSLDMMKKVRDGQSKVGLDFWRGFVDDHVRDRWFRSIQVDDPWALYGKYLPPQSGYK